MRISSPVWRTCCRLKAIQPAPDASSRGSRRGFSCGAKAITNVVTAVATEVRLGVRVISSVCVFPSPITAAGCPGLPGRGGRTAWRIWEHRYKNGWALQIGDRKSAWDHGTDVLHLANKQFYGQGRRRRRLSEAIREESGCIQTIVPNASAFFITFSLPPESTGIPSTGLSGLDGHPIAADSPKASTVLCR